MYLLIFSTMAAADIEQDINEQIKRDGNKWVANATFVEGMTIDEMRQLCGAKRVSIPFGARIIDTPRGKIGYPISFDWNNKNGFDWMSPVRNQGSCGSCWAFAAIGAVEGQINIVRKQANYDVDLSEQHLVSDCCLKCGSCAGGWPDYALAYVRDTGVPDEKCFPYTGKNGACMPCDDWDSYRITEYMYVANNADAFKAAITRGPIVVVLKVPEDWFWYESGVYEPTDVKGKFGWANHAVVLTGWDNTKDAWRVKNSWGSRWGEHGYGWVKYGTLEKYRYAFAVECPIIPTPSPISHAYVLTVSFGATEVPIKLPLNWISVTNENGIEVLRWVAV